MKVVAPSGNGSLFEQEFKMSKTNNPRSVIDIFFMVGGVNGNLIFEFIKSIRKMKHDMTHMNQANFSWILHVNMP